MKLLHQECPVLYRVLTTITYLSSSFVTLLLEMVRIVRIVTHAYPHILPPPQSDPMGFFPTLPVLQSRGIYSLDGQKVKADGTTACAKAPKKARQHPLSPGIFTMSCRHGMAFYASAIVGSGGKCYVHMVCKIQEYKFLNDN